MKRGLTILIIALMAAASTAWYFRDQFVSTPDNKATDAPEQTQHKPDPERYELLKQELAEKRQDLANSYNNASDPAAKDAILKQARTTLESYLLEMSHCWRGTPWDFNGTCKTPGSGKIACGYFVSTILQDTGIQCQRIKLAQQASQNIIATFVTRSDMHIRAGLSYDRFLEQEIARGPGWRIVGLDSHVGFLVVEADGKIRFIHSSPSTPCAVVDETREQADYLQRSNYRVTANITANKNFLLGWLTGKVWPTKTSS